MGVETKNVMKERLEWWRDAIEAGRVSPSMAKRISAERPMVAAARFFNLDMRKERDRNVLLFVLSDTVFRPVRRGRKKNTKKWDFQKLIDLGGHCLMIKHKNPKMSDRAAAEKIKKAFPDEYRHVNEPTIRQRLPKARRALLFLYENPTSTDERGLPILECDVEREIP
jgi:hypothetical protein